MPSSLSPNPFRLGAAEGVTPTKWVRIWRERIPGVPLELVPLGARGGEEAILSGAIDAGFVRLPVAAGGQELHVIPLYDEVPVVVAPKDHYLCAADEVRTEDFAREVVLDPVDGVNWPCRLGIPAREAPPDALAAIQQVAAGIGVLVVPKSLARLHGRRDLTYRRVVDLPTTTVGLAWRIDSANDLIEDLVGIVRGRTPRSTRGKKEEPAPKRTAAEKAAARKEYLAQQRGKAPRRGGVRKRKR